ncbi:MAG: hypothetical protein KAJ09_11620 [Deltaproteobacteria bacterium]|nr:hypothetical protein [Deltaproteobacteria bacterium]
MADIDEDGNSSPYDIAIAIILEGILPRVVEEVLFYNHGIEVPPPFTSKRPGLRPTEALPVSPFFALAADFPSPNGVEMSR